MTEPSEHARRAAEELASDSAHIPIIARIIDRHFDAATAELKADKDKVIEELSKWVLDGREVAFDLLSYDPCSCERPACKKCRRQRQASKFIKATAETNPEPKETK